MSPRWLSGRLTTSSTTNLPKHLNIYSPSIVNDDDTIHNAMQNYGNVDDTIDNTKVRQLLSTDRWNDQHWGHLHWLPGNDSTSIIQISHISGQTSEIYKEPIVLSWSRWIFRLLQSIIPVCGRCVWPPYRIVNSVFDYCPFGFQLFINQQLKTPLQQKWSLEIHIGHMQNMK